MAPFRRGHDELQHELPWRLMFNGPVTKYWRRAIFDEDLAELRARGFVLQRFDCSRWESEGAMFDELKAGLDLPAYTGSGLMALADSVSDIEIPDASGVVVALDNFNDVSWADALLDVLAGASRYWLLFGRILIVVLRTDDASYVGPRVSCTVPQWNGREWLNARRGL